MKKKYLDAADRLEEQKMDIEDRFPEHISGLYFQPTDELGYMPLLTDTSGEKPEDHIVPLTIFGQNSQYRT